MNPAPLHICVLTRHNQFLEYAAMLVYLPGLIRVNASLANAMRQEHKPDLIYGELGSEAFDQYLADRELSRAISAIPLIAFTATVNDASRNLASELGATDLFDLKNMSKDEIAGRTAHVLRAPANHRPLPVKPFAHNRINASTYAATRELADLPQLDSFCREADNALPTPIALFTYREDGEEHLAGLYEDVAQALRQYDPDDGTPSYCVDLAQEPKTALIEIGTIYSPDEPSNLATRVNALESPSP